MTCKYCEHNSPVYYMKCMDCCVRLILSTKPNKTQANNMIEHVRKCTGYSRAQVIEMIKGQRDKQRLDS